MSRRRIALALVTVVTAVLTTLTAAPALAAPRTYYLAATGSDAASGTTAATPWRTTARLAAVMPLGPGDRVLLQRGGSFGGGLTVTAAGTAAQPAVLGAYGTGAAPVLTGTSRVTGWTALGNDRWAATCPGCGASVRAVLRDGVTLPLARYPNPDQGDGYLYYESASGGTQLTDVDLPGTPSWVGGEAVVRTTPWLLDRLPVTAQSAGTLTFGASASYGQIQPGYGYFLQNDPDAIDREGEWSYAAGTKLLTLRTAVDPNTVRVEASTVDTVLRLDGVRNLRVSGLDVVGANTANVSAAGCTELTLTGVVSRQAGLVGARFTDCTGLSFSAGQIRGSLNNGLDVVNCTACVVRRSTIADTGMVAGMGQSYDGNYNAVRFGGPGSVFELNRVLRSGYLGVDVRGPATVRRNEVSFFNQVKVDGAGIYTWTNSDVEITENLVTDGEGSTAGIPWTTTATHGIYIDDNSQRITVRRNTITRTGDSGIYLHNTRAVTVESNTVVGAGMRGLLLSDDDLGAFGVEQTTARDNVFVATDPDSGMTSASSSVSDGFLAAVGSIDANVYCPVFGPPLLEAEQPSTPSGERLLTMPQWRTRTGFDATTAVCPVRHPQYTAVASGGPNTVANGTFTANLDGWFGWPDETLRATWDSGRMRVANIGSDLVHIDAPVGAVTAGRLYRVRLSGAAVADGRLVRIYLRQWNSPYRTLTPVRTVQFDATARSLDVFLPAGVSDPDALLIVEVPAATGTIWLDDVTVRPVTATPTDAADLVQLEANPSDTPRTVTVSGDGWIGLRGQPYPNGSTLTIAPWRSKVLVRRS